MLKFLLAPLLALFLPVAPTPTVSEAVLVGDSVVVIVSVADNTVPQTVPVDSVGLAIDFTVVGTSPPNTNILSTVVAHTAGTTSARFAYPLTLWAPNQTRSGRVCGAFGRINPEGGASLWSVYFCTAPAAWQYTRNLTPPATPEAGKVTASTAALN